MQDLNPDFASYLILPFTNEVSALEGLPIWTGTCETPKTITYKGYTYCDRTIHWRHYIVSKFLPSFDDVGTKEYDFGFGPKKIDNALLIDIPRTNHCLGHKELPRELTIGDQGKKDVVLSLYRIADYDDEILFKISQVYNQRVGIDLIRLARLSLNTDVEMPQLDDHHYHPNIYLEEIFGEDQPHIMISAFITGQVFDAINFELLPIRFRADARYDLTADFCTHSISFRLQEY